MRGHILVVDPIVTTRVPLKLKLSASFYDVTAVTTTAGAIAQLSKIKPDLVLYVHRAPEPIALAMIQRLGATGPLGGIPLLVLGVDMTDMLRREWLSAGAQEVVEHPCCEPLLLAHIRSLIRRASSAAEWQMQADTIDMLGFAEGSTSFASQPTICLIDPPERGLPSTVTELPKFLKARYSTRPLKTALDPCHEGQAAQDVFVLTLSAEVLPLLLSLIAALRSHQDTRHSVIICLAQDVDATAAATMLDLGADAVVDAGCNPAELGQRIRSLTQAKTQIDQMRRAMRSGLDAAMYDPLTRLLNRRYALPHLERVAERAVKDSKPLAVMFADLDHFKQVNDRYGHSAGDVVLTHIARLLQANLREEDVVARIGGEEFLIILPGLNHEAANSVAQRLCAHVAQTPAQTDCGQMIGTTLSIGLSVFAPPPRSFGGSTCNGRALIDAADAALYRAKTNGRNQVSTAPRPQTYRLQRS